MKAGLEDETATDEIVAGKHLKETIYFIIWIPLIRFHRSIKIRNDESDSWEFLWAAVGGDEHQVHHFAREVCLILQPGPGSVTTVILH